MLLIILRGAVKVLSAVYLKLKTSLKLDYPIVK